MSPVRRGEKEKTPAEFRRRRPENCPKTPRARVERHGFKATSGRHVAYKLTGLTSDLPCSPSHRVDRESGAPVKAEVLITKGRSRDGVSSASHICPPFQAGSAARQGGAAGEVIAVAVDQRRWSRTAISE